MKIFFARAAFKESIAFSDLKSGINKYLKTRINPHLYSGAPLVHLPKATDSVSIEPGSNSKSFPNKEHLNFTQRMDLLIWKCSTRLSLALSDFRLQFQYRVRNLIIDERGDVPGWVLVVLMTTGLVTGIWTVAAPRIESLLRGSLDSMNNVR